MKNFLLLLFLLSLYACQEDNSALQAPQDNKAVVTVSKEIPVPKGQLSKDLVPTSSSIELTVIPDEEYFQGTTTINVNVNESSNKYYIHGNLLEDVKVSIKTKGRQTIQGSYKQVHKSGIALLTFPEVIGKGKAQIIINYKAKFNESLEGLYKVNDGGLNYAFTQFESISARLAFSGFDEPAFKIPFDISLRVKENQVAIANTPIKNVKSLANGMKKVTFKTTKPLPSYLVAFIVGEFDVVKWQDLPTTGVRNRTVALSGIATKGKGAKLKYALQHTKEIVEGLENYFNIPYPYEKLDIVAVPDFSAGAMENAGLITYREQLLLLDDDASQAQKRSYMGVHAHELAHQWFGNLVTPYWWNDIWLNEAFATWMSYTALQNIYPEQHFNQTILRGSLGAMGSDSLMTARQIRQPIKSNHDISGAFDGITYSKGGGVLEMMNTFLTTEQFRKGIHNYMTKFAFKNASADDFIHAISETSKNIPAEVIKSSFNSFLEQPGIPYLAIETNCEDGINKLAITQNRYLPLGSKGSADQLWEIPACMSYEIDGKKHQDCHMINKKEQTIKLAGNGCASYIVPNSGGSGYYRYALTTDNWDKLYSNLDKLPTNEIISLNDSFSAAVKKGTIDFITLMKYAPIIAESNLNNIATSPMRTIRYMKEKVAQNEDDENKIAKVANQLYQKKYQQLGFHPKHNDDVETTKLRRSIIGFLADTGENKAIRKQLNDMAIVYTGFATDKLIHEDLIDADLIELALSIAGEDLGMEFTNHLITLLDKTNDGTIRGRLLSAIASSKDPTFNAEIRNWVLSDRLRGNEIYTILFSQIMDKDKIDGMWFWIQNNFEAFKERIPTWFQGKLPMVGSGFCSESKKEELINFFEPIIESLSGGPRTLAQTVEGIDLCIAKLKHDRPMLKAYLDTVK